jgi:hypothetical protein
MWLPMNMDTSRNVTYNAILAGKETRSIFSMPFIYKRDDFTKTGSGQA